MNVHAIAAIYGFEMARTRRTLMQSVISPVLSTSLYFVVFGSAIGSRIPHVDGVSYGAFIVPGLIMLSLLTQSVSNASFGIYFPRFTGTIYELLSAPISYLEIVIAYVGAAATKSLLLGVIILATAAAFVPLRIEHPVFMVTFLVLTAVTFSLLGFIIGIWADGFEKLQLVPLLILTPLAFLGGTFYSIEMLPPLWQKVTLLNPVVYLVSGFRWSFYGQADVHIAVSIAMTLAFLGVFVAIAGWIFKTGYRLKTYSRRTESASAEGAQMKTPSHSGLGAKWWPRAELNHRHTDFQSAALPTELLGQAGNYSKIVGRVRPLLLRPGGVGERQSAAEKRGQRLDRRVRRLLRQVVAAWQRLAAHVLRHRTPVVERMEQPVDDAFLAPQHQRAGR